MSQARTPQLGADYPGEQYYSGPPPAPSHYPSHYYPAPYPAHYPPPPLTSYESAPPPPGEFSPHSDSSSHSPNSFEHTYHPYYAQESVFFSGDGVGPIRADKRNKLGVGSNKKERRRTQSINAAFSSLRDCIPNVPCDTKLSKIKTLRLATSYIDYLINVLKSDDPNSGAEGFKADIHKKWNEKTEEQKRKELEEELNNNRGEDRVRSHTQKPSRTGWPQHVWALELKQ